MALRARLLIVLAILASACESDGVQVSRGGSDVIYGHSELVAAVRRFSTTTRSPASYRELGRTIAALRPRFDATVASEATRHLIFLAVEPLDAFFDQPLEAQVDALALTVWPTVLDVEPLQGETPAGYMDRLCKDGYAKLCRQIVPEHRPLVLSELVWRRFESRARDVMAECSGCQGAGFAAALATFGARHEAMAARLVENHDRIRPWYWPFAGEHGAPWSGAPLVTVSKDGSAVFQGQTIAPGRWREALTAGRDAATTLGVLMPRTADVSELRAILRDAGAAGYAQVALQVRGPSYPYPLEEYRLKTRARAGRARAELQVRDVDSIQVLIESLDARAATGAAPPML